MATFEPHDLQPWRNNMGITIAANLAAGERWEEDLTAVELPPKLLDKRWPGAPCTEGGQIKASAGGRRFAYLQTGVAEHSIDVSVVH